MPLALECQRIDPWMSRHHLRERATFSFTLAVTSGLEAFAFVHLLDLASSGRDGEEWHTWWCRAVDYAHTPRRGKPKLYDERDFELFGRSIGQ